MHENFKEKLVKPSTGKSDLLKLEKLRKSFNNFIDLNGQKT
jgi:hypothetical protein